MTTAGSSLTLALMLAITAATPFAAAQDSCVNRGQLDTLYCDANNDLVADLPTDAAKIKDPSTLIFSYSAVEAPQI